MKKLEEKRHKVEFPNWIDFLVKPLAEELSKSLGAKHYEVYGPFGIRAETSICFRLSGQEDEDQLRIVLTPRDLDKGELYYDTGEKKNEFSDNTVGSLNGFNNVEAPLPETFEEILEIVKNSVQK